MMSYRYEIRSGTRPESVLLDRSSRQALIERARQDLTVGSYRVMRVEHERGLEYGATFAGTLTLSPDPTFPSSRCLVAQFDPYRSPAAIARDEAKAKKAERDRRWRERAARELAASIDQAIGFLSMRGMYEEHPDDPDDESITRALRACWDRHSDHLGRNSIYADARVVGSDLADWFESDLQDEWYSGLERWACPCGRVHVIDPSWGAERPVFYDAADDQLVDGCRDCGRPLLETRRDVALGQIELPMTEEVLA